ncbi:methionine aminopeptidase, putative, partial [Ixodes scapularis]
ITRPGTVSSTRYVPDSIAKPSYATSGIVVGVPKEMEVKSADQIARMRESCRLAKMIVNRVSKCIKAGVTTDELDKFAHSLCIEHNAYPSPLNYRWFPKSVCTSVNNKVCKLSVSNRGPSGYECNAEPIVFYNGYHGDCAETHVVGGSVDDRGRALVHTAEECLNRAIQVCGPGQPLREIGRVIRWVTMPHSLYMKHLSVPFVSAVASTVPQLSAHENEEEGEMFEGLVFTIEPVISEGSPEITILDDGWTAVTTDQSRTAQFEHTVYICSEGAEVLTVL